MPHDLAPAVSDPWQEMAQPPDFTAVAAMIAPAHLRAIRAQIEMIVAKAVSWDEASQLMRSLSAQIHSKQQATRTGLMKLCKP